VSEIEEIRAAADRLNPFRYLAVVIFIISRALGERHRHFFFKIVEGPRAFH